MRFALVNPAWTFEGSTYFGCQEPHYPLELLFAYDKVHEAGHSALLIDAQLERLNTEEVRKRLADFHADFLVIPTAPSYLFWRCPPRELRVPQKWFAELGNGAVRVAIGPHSSATPAATLRKLNCDVALRGEPDETIPQLAGTPWREIPGCCWKDEIFGVGKNVRRLLQKLAERPISIGLQTRIDLWNEETLDLLGNARCISMECGIESITEEGRDELNKGCKLSTDRLSELLIYARKRTPWVQANLILTEHD